MAHVLGNALSRGQAEPWMLQLVLALADDDDDEVVRAALNAVTSVARNALELPGGWIERLAATRAALLGPEVIIELAARRGEPSAVSNLVLRCARRFMDEPRAPNAPYMIFSRAVALNALSFHLAQLIEAQSRAASRASPLAQDALGVWEQLLLNFPGPTVGRTRIFVG